MFRVSVCLRLYCRKIWVVIIFILLFYILAIVNEFSLNNLTISVRLQALDLWQHFSRNQDSTNPKVSNEPILTAENGASTGKAQAVILLTQIRFGSTFLGELFNKKTNVTYFYEPVWQFPSHHMQDAVNVINDLSRCRFDRLADIYKKVYDRLSFDKEWAR